MTKEPTERAVSDSSSSDRLCDWLRIRLENTND
jgi:hypothetical protein